LSKVEEIEFMGSCNPLFIALKKPLYLPSLKRIHLPTTFSIDDDLCELISISCPNIEEFRIFRNSILSDEGFLFLTMKCSELKRLELRKSNGLTDQSLYNLSNGCKKLENLSIESMPCITDKGIQSIAFGLYDSLQNLSIMCCESVSSHGFQNLNRLVNLKSLELAFCRVNDHIISCILSSCSKLEILNLTCTPIGDSSISQLSQNSEIAPNLELLLVYKTRISIQCIQSISNIRPNLSIRNFQVAQ
jgi:hypothetical protein